MSRQSHARGFHTAGFSSPLKVALLAILGVLAPMAAPAAPVDLGSGLAYLRLRQLRDDEPALTAAWESPALVIDLRHTAGDPGAAFAAKLRVRSPVDPLFVLVSPATPAAAVSALRLRAAALLTIGSDAAKPAPDLGIAVSPEADQLAYDALEGGAPAAALIAEDAPKSRRDEASLSLEHNRAKGAPAPAEPSVDNTPAKDAAAPAPASPRDIVLKRAVQLHRALQAFSVAR